MKKCGRLGLLGVVVAWWGLCAFGWSAEMQPGLSPGARSPQDTQPVGIAPLDPTALERSSTLGVTRVPALSLEDPFFELLLEQSVWVDASCRLGLEAVRAADQQLRQVSVGDAQAAGSGFCIWRRAVVSFSDSGAVLAEIGYHAYAQLYLLHDGKVLAKAVMGNALPLNERSCQITWSKAYRNLAALDVKAGEVYTIYYRTRDPYGTHTYGKNHFNGITFWRKQTVLANAERHNWVVAFVHGWLLLLLLYHSVQWVISRNRLLFAYVCFVASIIFYLAYEEFLLQKMFPWLVVNDYYFILSTGLVGAAFFQFSREVFASVSPKKGFDQLMRAFQWEKLAVMVVWLLAYALGRHGQEWLNGLLTALPDWYRITLLAEMVVVGVLLSIAYRRQRNLILRTFALGTAAISIPICVYLSLAFLYPFEHLAPVAAYVALVKPLINYLVEAAMVLMSLIMAIGVALAVREREVSVERAFNQRLAHIELSALRAQMNPHFLFNGLNSIRRFVIKSQPKEASDYLTKFARLIRLILENSNVATIPLARELETLRLYLDLEVLRFDDKFTARFEIDPDVDLEYMEVPPTVLQPYVENAIWHGLLHRTEPGGTLLIRVRSLPHNRVQISIIDNGVGRTEAARLKSRSATSTKSMGMAITAERLSLLGQTIGFAAEVQIIDLGQDNTRPTGTEVQITIDCSGARQQPAFTPESRSHVNSFSGPHRS